MTLSLTQPSLRLMPLPLLEHVLWQLYRKQLPRKDGLLRWSDYRELGELEGALANHAESVFLALDGDAQAALKPVIRQLVSPGPGEDGGLDTPDGSVPRPCLDARVQWAAGKQALKGSLTNSSKRDSSMPRRQVPMRRCS